MKKETKKVEETKEVVEKKDKAEVKEEKKEESNKKVLLLIGVVIVVIVVLLVIFLFPKSDEAKVNYDSKKDIYEIENGKIIIEDDFVVSYNVKTKQYTLTGTVTNKTKKEYKNLELTFEFYDQQKNTIGKTTKKIEKIKANGKVEMKFALDDTKVPIYDYKITKAEVK